MIKTKPGCQVCGYSNLEEVLDLGYQPLCNEFMAPENTGPQTYYPLGLSYCPDCSLVQLGYVIPTKLTFGDQYTYLTGSSRSLVDYYSMMAQEMVTRFHLQPGDAVVEIGSNDGTFLKAFKSLGISVLGVEGASTPANMALTSGIPTLVRFFGEGAVQEIKNALPASSNVRLVVGMNVLAHTDNINEFLAEVVKLMGDDTVFVSQSHWLTELVRECEFDTIYHEHLRYYTIESLTKLFQRHKLNIIDAEHRDFYGGSILTYATTGSQEPTKSLEAIMREEQRTNIPQGLRDMKEKLVANKAKLQQLLVEIKSEGKRVIGVGAPMKSSTLLNYYGITPDLVEYLAEVNDLKVGTVVPGVRIPVLHENIVFQCPPDYALLLSWNMADSIIPKYRESGFKGKFILPVPEVEIID